MYGLEALAELAQDAFAGTDPLAMLFRGATHEIQKNAEGYDVVFNLPLAKKSDVELSKRGAELFVRVGSYRRNILLPDSIARFHAAGASIEDGRLRVRLHDGAA
jgi:arsenite-transporting ATPase